MGDRPSPVMTQKERPRHSASGTRLSQPAERSTLGRFARTTVTVMPIQSGFGNKLRCSCAVFRAVSSIGNPLPLAFQQKRRRRSPGIDVQDYDHI